MSEYISFSVTAKVATINIDRPKLRNAFNPEMISCFSQLLDEVTSRDDVKVLVLRAEGKSFCAGADLNWLKSVKDYSFEENLADAQELADLMEKLFKLPKPTIGRIQGDAVGGGAGMVAALDVVVAAEKAHFSFSEARLGMAPSVISPYLMYRIGPQRCRRLFLTGERINAEEACQMGLVDVVVKEEELDERVQRVVSDMMASSLEALRKCKEIAQTIPYMEVEAITPYTTKCIAELRLSDEAQKRMAGFLKKMMDKKKP